MPLSGISGHFLKWNTLSGGKSVWSSCRALALLITSVANINMSFPLLIQKLALEALLCLSELLWIIWWKWELIVPGVCSDNRDIPSSIDNHLIRRAAVITVSLILTSVLVLYKRINQRGSQDEVVLARIPRKQFLILKPYQITSFNIFIVLAHLTCLHKMECLILLLLTLNTFFFM